jgi:hypothetical protein
VKIQPRLFAPNAMPKSMFPKRFQTDPLPVRAAENRFISEIRFSPRALKKLSRRNQKTMIRYGFDAGRVRKPLWDDASTVALYFAATDVVHTASRQGEGLRRQV